MTLNKIMLMMVSVAFIVSCTNPKDKQSNTQSNAQNHADVAHNNERVTDKSMAPELNVFSGCYAFSLDEVSNIKISQQNNQWVMQMKEPESANRVWDTPEPLEPISHAELHKYFAVNASQIDTAIARPDRVLVMAHLKPSYVNLDPLIDSEYLAYVYKADVPIYHVNCDNTKVDIIGDAHANAHANIGIHTKKEHEKPSGE